MEHLICAGALDPFTASHWQARWEAQLARAAPHAQPALLPEIEHQFLPSVLPETAYERAHEEYAALGWTRSVSHPLVLYEAALAGTEVLLVARFGQQVGKAATVAGIVVATRRIRTQQGKPMPFLSLCDASGVAELVVFDDSAAHDRGYAIACGHVICAHGKVTDDAARSVTLDVSGLRVLDC